MNATLKSISITGKAVGGFFFNEIEQVFTNGGDSNVEFIYTFPMPENASVSSFSAQAGEERFVGVVKAKEAAFEEYQAALSKGDSAYMLESHRDNIFQASLGNVAKGEEVTVNISYMQEIKLINNELRLLIPTLVSPRYIPGRPTDPKTGMGSADPTDRVPDADYITPQQGSAEYKADFHISFDLDSNIKEISSPSHNVKVEIDGSKAEVTLSQAELDSDFVLNVSLHGGKTEKFIRSEVTPDGCFSYVSFIPKLKPLPAVGKEYVFMIDVSGSMQGGNLESAKKALKICLRNMEPGDIFNIIAFESSFECFAESGTALDEHSFAAANMWIDSLRSLGGTEIYNALRYAVESMESGGGREKIIMLLTDGQVGNENEIIKYASSSFDGRIFCVGIDFNVNDSFLNKISAVGNGFTELYYPGSSEDLAAKIVRQFSRSNAAYLKDVRFEADCEIEPAGKPPKYLYSDERCTAVLKSDRSIDALYVIGNDGETEIKLHLAVTDTGACPVMLGKMWAKKTIAETELESHNVNPRHENLWTEKIIETSIKYGVISRYTSFVAVNERTDKFSGLPKAAAIAVNPPKRIFADINGNTGSLPLLGVYSDSSDDLDLLVSHCRYAAPSPTFNIALSADLAMADPLFSQKPKAKKGLFNIFKREAKPDGAAANERFEAESFQPRLYSNHAPRPISAADEVKSLILELIKDIGGREGQASGHEFAGSTRAKFIELALKSGSIDFASCFNEIDIILSIIEKHIGKGDQAVDDSYQKLLKLLDENCILGDESKNLSDIACMQNYDGSFCHCTHLKTKYSLLALERFSGADDSFLYSKQIKKLTEYFQRENPEAIADLS